MGMFLQDSQKNNPVEGLSEINFRLKKALITSDTHQRTLYEHLVILHYLEMADGTPLGQRMTSFGELRDGLVRGGSFDRTCE